MDQKSEMNTKNVRWCFYAIALNSGAYSNTTGKSFGISINFRNIFLRKVMTEESLQKKMTKLSKKGRGRGRETCLFFYSAIGDIF